MHQINDRLSALWLAEAVKHKEKAGTIEDSLALTLLARDDAHTGLEDKALICLRAKYLSLHNPVVEPLVRQMHRLFSIGKLSLLALAVTAIMSGIALAGSVLLHGNRLNVFLVLAILLIPHVLGLLWVALLYGRIDSSSSLIVDAWEWLIGRIGRRHNATLLMESMRSMLGRKNSLPLMLLGISHFWWILFASSTMLTMILYFSVIEYTFTWGTTILQPESFYKIVNVIGWLPSLVGFPKPEGADIRALTDTLDIRRTWAYFILGCLTVYALVPRLLMLGWSLAEVQKGLRHLSLSFDDTYYINTLGRIKSALRKPPEIVDPTTRCVDPTGVPEPNVARKGPLTHTSGIIPFELRDENSMKMLGENSGWQVFDNVVDAQSQEAAFSAINKHGLSNIVAVFDARNTADRGAFQFLRLLGSKCGGLQVVLLNQEDASPNKVLNWKEGLKEVGLESILGKLPDILSSPATTS